MNDQDYIIKIFKYFARFVPTATLQDALRQPSHSAIDGYNAAKAEILQPSVLQIADIDTYVCSAHPGFVADRIKNAKGLILFVEYGGIGFNPVGERGVSKNLGITIAHDYNHSNNDNLNEALLMNRCNNILNQILAQIEADQHLSNGCTVMGMANFPAQCSPINAEEFFGRYGWTATLTVSQTYL